MKKEESKIDEEKCKGEILDCTKEIEDFMKKVMPKEE